MENLQAAEAIKQLKARYFRWLDTKQWQTWSAVFTHDVVMAIPEQDRVIEGRQAVVQYVHDEFVDAQTIHHGFMPEIEFISDSEATGVWAMEGRVETSEENIHSFGHYHEAYRIEDGGWRIARIALHRLRVDNVKKS